MPLIAIARGQLNPTNYLCCFSLPFLFSPLLGHGISWRSPDMCRLLVPRIPGDYTGTGDLTAALLLAWLHLTPGDAPSRLEGVLENVIATVQATLKRTRAEAGESAELRLIQSKEDIER